MVRGVPYLEIRRTPPSDSGVCRGVPRVVPPSVSGGCSSRAATACRRGLISGVPNHVPKSSCGTSPPPAGQRSSPFHRPRGVPDVLHGCLHCRGGPGRRGLGRVRRFQPARQLYATSYRNGWFAPRSGTRSGTEPIHTASRLRTTPSSVRSICQMTSTSSPLALLPR